MDSYHVFWLLDELKILVQNKVITEETAGRISEYYKNTAPKPLAPKADNAGREIQRQPTSGTAENIYQHINRQKPGSKKPLLTAASIPVLLSVIAAVLIAAGTISLAAYNWNVIPRTVKAFIAFILLIAVQSAGTFICLKGEKFAKGRWREGAAVLWSLMFGGVVAFISQICRLPGDTASFLLVWAVSSIILTYTMESLGAFAISLLLSASYIVTCRAGVSSSGAEALLFYLMLIALCPFSLRFEYGSRIMLIFASCMLGFTLEKSIPGLWTVCSVSFTVFSLEFSLSRGYRKLATFSAASLCILLLVLSYNSVWCGIGWQNIRKSHSIVGIVTDIAVALGLTGAAVALPLTDFRRKKIAAWQLVYPFCALAVMLLFIIYGFFDNKTQLSTCLAPTVIVLIFSVLFLAHILHSRKTYSIFLLFFLFSSSVITGLNIPVFAIALLLLLLEATGTFPSSVVRGAVFAFLLAATACMTLQESPSWHGASMLHYALFKP
ncbi:MAG: DUF2157 domain-containing protein, partial [Treponema sp.]|nr:DUF2157 domain-containing protein [Treponema sp.]